MWQDVWLYQRDTDFHYKTILCVCVCVCEKMYQQPVSAMHMEMKF
jgi:hypothetical protein